MKSPLMQTPAWLPLLAALAALGFGGHALAADPAAPAVDDAAAKAATPAKVDVPSMKDSSAAAFKKLAAGKKSVSLEDAKALPGFEKVFEAADANHDGQLSASEFNTAWKAYTAAEKSTRG